MVRFVPKANKSVTYVQAAPCSKHTGVYNKQGIQSKPKHNMFVDNNLMAEVRAYMSLAIVASIKALFCIFG